MIGRKRYIILLIMVVLMMVGVSHAMAAPNSQDEDGDEGENHFCTSADVQHPLAAKLAETYEVSYDQVMTWFCEENYGFGQISMALQTSKLTGDSPEALLAQRTEGQGWGQIWKAKGLISRSEDGGPPPWAGHGRPPWAGPKSERSGEHPGKSGENNGNNGNNGQGSNKDNGNKPCWAGPGPLPEGCEKPVDQDD